MTVNKMHITELVDRLCEGMGNDPYRFLTDEPSELVEEIVGLACEMFITSDGRTDYTAIRNFERESGCRVGPGEVDSFGWLSGVIYTKAGKIVFG